MAASDYVPETPNTACVFRGVHRWEADSALSEPVSLLLGPQTTDPSRRGMPKASFKVVKLLARLGIPGLCGSPEPLPIRGHVVSIEVTHRRVICGTSVAHSICPTIERCRAESVCGPAESFRGVVIGKPVCQFDYRTSVAA